MRFFMSGMAAVLLVATTGPTSAGQQNIIIREHLGQRWTRELVTYPFAAEKGQCHPNSIKLIGPDGPVPVQPEEAREALKLSLAAVQSIEEGRKIDL